MNANPCTYLSTIIIILVDSYGLLKRGDSELCILPLAKQESLAKTGEGSRVPFER